jgi:serine/threonine protein kinase
MGDASGRPELSRDALIGKLALERRWITPLQLREALSEQWAEVETGRSQARSLGEILVARGILSAPQLDELLQKARGFVPSFPPFGKFNILRELGRGAMGVVYEAEDAELRRRVALKMLIAPPPQDPEEAKPEQERFLRESQLHKSLPPHPGIVPVLEAGVVEGRRYIAMELVDGVSMGIWHRHGSVTVRQRVAMLRDVALAVHHAHRNGVIHRDLKPENILVDRNHQPRITDFGLAKLVGSSAQPLATATGTALGTPAYMSPEQIRGARDVDHRADLYALGVMLYEILTGRRPFGGESPYEIMMRTVNDQVVAPSKITNLKINPVLYRNLENICLIALAKKPGDRYPDAEAMARDLTKWLKGEDFRIVVPRSWHVWRARKLLPLPFAGAALIAVTLAGTLYLRSRDNTSATALKGPFTRADALLPGAVVESYAGLNFNVLGLRKIDSRAAFDDAAAPLWKEGPAIWCSRRWSGVLKIEAASTYHFEVQAKEQIRLTIDDQELVSGEGTRTATIALKAGAHKFLLEHAHKSAEDGVQVLWKKEGDRATAPLGPGAIFHPKAGFQALTPPSPRYRLPNVPGAEEGELLQVISDSGHPPQVHSYGMYGAFWKGTWSGDGHLWWGPGVQKGDRLKVRFAAGEAVRGTLAIGLTRAPDHGIFKISVNGALIAEPLDLWSADLLTREVEFKDVQFKAGPNDLEFEVVGSNPSAREWGPGNGIHKLGLDYVLVR